MATAISIKNTEVTQGERLCIFPGGNPSPQTRRVVHWLGVVTDTTPKALRVRLEAERGQSHSLWLPRRALTHLVRDRSGIRGGVARWWTPVGRQAEILSLCRLAAVVGP